MKKIIYSLAALAMAVTFTGCASDDDNTSGKTSGKTSLWTNPLNDTIPYATSKATAPQVNALLQDYVDNVVKPTYTDLKNGNANLNAKVKAFLNNPTQANLDAAANEWIAARAPWETSEAFLFGPVADLELDPNMDAWPLKRAEIQEMIKSGNFPEEISTAQDIIGFHTLEYLLYQDGQARNIATDTEYKDYKDNYAKYMQQVAQFLENDAATLYAAWFTDADKYETTFYNEGVQSIYEILQGMWTIANEVGGAKIGEPYALYLDGKEEDALYAVESWYSWHSREDYCNNIRSIRNCYFGKYGESMFRNGNATPAPNSLANYVSANLGKDYDNKMRAAINDAMNAIWDIEAPFRSHIASDQSKVAMEKCATLRDVIKEITGKLGGTISEEEEEE